MSVVNEALKKAAQERSQVQNIHPVDTEKSATKLGARPAVAPAASKIPAISAGILIVAMIGGIVGLYLAKTQETERRVQVEYQLNDTRTELQAAQGEIRQLEAEKVEMAQTFNDEKAAMTAEIENLYGHMDSLSTENTQLKADYDHKSRVVAMLSKRLHDIRRSLGL